MLLLGDTPQPYSELKALEFPKCTLKQMTAIKMIMVVAVWCGSKS